MRPDCAHLVAFRRAAAASSVTTSQQPPCRALEDALEIHVIPLITNLCEICVPNYQTNPDSFSKLHILTLCRGREIPQNILCPHLDRENC